MRGEWGRTKPPPGALLNRSDPRARGIVAFWLANEASGRLVRDATGNGFDGVFTGSLAWRPAAGGIGLRGPGGGASGLTVSRSLTQRFPAGEASLVFWLRRTAATPAVPADGGICFLQDFSDITYSYYPYTNGLAYFMTFRLGAANRINDITLLSSVDRTQWHQLAITTRPGTGNYRIYQNAQLVTAATGQAAVTITGTQMIIDSLSNQGFAGQVESVLLANVAYSAAELSDLVEEPYSMFEWPRLSSVYTAGAGPAQRPWPIRQAAVPVHPRWAGQ